MKHTTKVFCSNIIKDPIPKAKAYEAKVIEIASKYGKDLAKAEQQAEELYAPSARHDNSTMSYYDTQARKKAEEEKSAELKILTERRKAYVDSKKESLVPAARNAIRSAQSEFQEEAAKVAKTLREKLEDDVATPLNSAFLHFARVFNEFNLPMTDLDCHALMDLSEDNPTAFRIIESIISKTNSPYTFTGKGTDSYAEDIRLIEKLSSDDCFCVPMQVSHEMNDLFVGEPVFRKEAETLEDKIENGFNPTFTTMQLSMCSGDFQYKAEKLSEIAESWSSDAKVEYDAAKAFAKENAEKAGNQANARDAIAEYMK